MLIAFALVVLKRERGGQGGGTEESEVGQDCVRERQRQRERCGAKHN